MDPTPDPEAEPGSLNKLADLMRLLAPPAASAQDTEAESGARLFEQIDCQNCHFAGYVSKSPDAALDHRNVPLYSDLLLHDVGTRDGIAQADANEHELRTPPLWGVGHAQIWLHDGRAHSMDEVIRMHAGQALSITSSYEGLAPEERAAVVAF